MGCAQSSGLQCGTPDPHFVLWPPVWSESTGYPRGYGPPLPLLAPLTSVLLNTSSGPGPSLLWRIQKWVRNHSASRHPQGSHRYNRDTVLFEGQGGLPKLLTENTSEGAGLNGGLHILLMFGKVLQGYIPPNSEPSSPRVVPETVPLGMAWGLETR